MNRASSVKVILENLADGARAPAPGSGRRPAFEADPDGVRAVVEAFASLPAAEAEDADARLLLSRFEDRLVVRYAGGRLILEGGGAFANTSVNDIMARISAAPAARSAKPAEPVTETPASGLPGKYRKILALAAVLAVLALVCWRIIGPKDMPSGVELESAENVCQAVLGKAAGQYGGDSGTLRIFAVDSRMVLTDNAGKVTLRTVLRVGRRAGVLVLVTEAGSVLEFAPDGVIRFGVVTYKRVP